MAIVLIQHVLAVYNLRNPISISYHHVNCSQFGIHRIVNETLVLYVPVTKAKKKFPLNFNSISFETKIFLKTVIYNVLTYL